MSMDRILAREKAAKLEGRRLAYREKKARAYMIAELKARQDRDGFTFGYLSHAARTPRRDAAVIAWLDKNGYDQEDAYQALNSKAGRHMGDWLSDPDLTKEEIESRIARSLWPTPAAMYQAFGQTKAELAQEPQE